MIEYVLIVLFIFLVYFWNQWFKKGPKFPPGPSQFSVTGQLVLFREKKHIVLNTMGKKYGPIFHVYFAGKYVIILNSYEAIKEAYSRKGDCFLDRPHLFMFDWLHNNEGLAFSVGENWRQQHRFVNHTLNECGFGKTITKSKECVTAEEILMIEIQHLIEIIASHKGKPFSLHHFMDRFITNVIFTFLFDERFDYHNETADKLIDFIDQFFKNLSPLNPINFFPPIRFISKSFKKFKQSVKFARNYFNSIIENHDHTYHPEYHRNFVDVYLCRIKADQINKISDSTFTKGNLLKIVECLFAGVTTVSATLLWFMKFMIIYPEKQKKLREELHKGFAASNLIYLSDRPKIPFTEATILENHRIASITPLPLFRLSTEDVRVFNYVIPKDTLVLANLYAAHNDESYWPNPKEFTPERFLDLEGHVKKNIEGLIPFSVGHRCCPGKPLAQNLLTLFVANLFHRFEFVAPENEPPPDLNNYEQGLVLRPYAFNVCAKLG